MLARVTVCQPDGKHVQVTVEDQGAGFDPSSLGQIGANGTGLGLRGMRERLELLDCRLEVDSVPGRGTRITLTAPVGITETENPTTPHQPCAG